MTVLYSDTMTDLATGNVVVEADMDLIRKNIESIHDQIIIFEEAQDAADFNTTSTSYVDVTGCSVSVTLPVAMRVAVNITGTGWNGGAATATMFNISVDGAEIDAHATGVTQPYATDPENMSFTRWISLAAGTYTIALSMKVSGSTGYVSNPVIQVIGFMET